jgi:hypothetical protein
VQWGLLTGQGSRTAWQVSGALDIQGSKGASTLPALCATLQKLSGDLPLNCAQGLELRVVIADIWLPTASIPWNPDMLRQDSARAFARDYLSHLGFSVTSGDEIRLDDAPYGMARLAVAYPQELLQAIEQCALRWRAHWRSLRPVSVLAWSVLGKKRQAGAMAILDEDSVTLCLAGAKRWTGRTHVQEVKIQSHPPGCSAAEALALAWERLRLRRPHMPDAQEVLVLDASDTPQANPLWPEPFVQPDESWRNLQHNAHWLQACQGIHALDAHVLPPRRTWKHWAILGIAIIIASGVVFETWRQFLRANASRNAYENLQQTTRKLPPSPWSREELARIGAVNAAIRQLNLPIGAVLQALRPPRDIRVAVLQVETSSAATGEAANLLKITAEAPSSAEMTRYVAFVSEQKPFMRAYLTHHEHPDKESTERFRFTMEAQWND